MKVLVIHEVPDVVEVVSLCLRMRWPQATCMSASSGTEGILLIKNQGPDVVVLDELLPDMNGYEICQEIRRFSDVPIVMLSTTDKDTHIARTLDAGADSCIAKPFSPIELLSRVQAVVRRNQKLPLSKREGTFSSGKVTIDYDSREVQVAGEGIKLTPTEYNLLYYLTQNAGRLLTYQSLLSEVWGKEYQHDKVLLSSHIHNLRCKLGDDLQNPKVIINERSIGYRFEKVDS